MDRLTNLIKPRKIFMGRKDYQQLFLVKNYIEKKYKTKVIGCKTIRNKNNLALSSRNFLLGKNDLKEVENISKKFFNLKKGIKKHKNINKFLRQSKKKFEKMFKIKIEYLENRNIKNLQISNKYLGSKIFLSYYFKDIRLIDNF
jgi:pantoate--beta-alanine ligase